MVNARPLGAFLHPIPTYSLLAELHGNWESDLFWAADFAGNWEVQNVEISHRPNGLVLCQGTWLCSQNA
jgi:hypothetical protein